MHYQIYTGFKRGVKVLGIFNVCARPQARSSRASCDFLCDERTKAKAFLLARTMRARKSENKFHELRIGREESGPHLVKLGNRVHKIEIASLSFVLSKT